MVVELYDLQGGQKKVGGNQVADLLPLLLDDHHRHRPKAFHHGDELGYFEGFILSIQEDRNLSKSRSSGSELSNGGPLSFLPDDGIRFQL